MLLDEIDRGSGHSHQHELLAPEFIVRDSTTTPRHPRSVS
jgi:hypothetical protein